MPRIVSGVPQTYENIVRPVALEVARHLGKMLNLPADIKVLMPGAAETTLWPKTELANKDPGDSVTFGHNARLSLEVIENPVEDRILTTAIHQKENLPIFLDKNLGVKIYPVYSGTELTFNFTYRSENRVTARHFRNELLTRTSAMREEILHESSYYYHVPYVFLHLLEHLHALRENQGGYDQDWHAYVNEHITDRATTVTDQIGKNQALAIREFQTHPLGVFQFIGTTDAEEKEKDSGTWSINFGYKFVFDQVVDVVCEYPLFIHNQLVDPQWRSSPWASGELTDPNRRMRLPSLSRYAFDHFVKDIYPSFCKQVLTDGYVIPDFDEWRPSHTIPNTSSLFVACTQVDPAGSTTLFELMEDLDGFRLDPALREFILGEAPYMTTKGASIFDLRLFEGEYPMDDGLLSVTRPDLIVVSNATMDIRKLYHVRLALVNDLFTLGPAAWERLRSGGEAAVQIINCLQFKMLGKAFEPKLLGGRWIKNEDLRLIAQTINDLKVPHKGPLEYVMLTVNEVVIVANRSSDNGTVQVRSDGTTPGGSDSAEDPFTKPATCDG